MSESAESGMYHLYRSELDEGAVLKELYLPTKKYFKTHGVPIAVEIETGEWSTVMNVDLGGGITGRVFETRDNGMPCYGLAIRVEFPDGDAYISDFGMGPYVSAGYFYLELAEAAHFAWNHKTREGKGIPMKKQHPSAFRNLEYHVKALVKSWSESWEQIDVAKARAMACGMGFKL